MTEDFIPSKYDVRAVQSVTLPSEPLLEQGASITKIDYRVLLEGGQVDALAGRRNTAIGVAGTAILGIIGLWGSTTLQAKDVVNWSAIGALCALAVISVVAVIFTIVFWIQVKRTKERESFQDVKRKIERQLSGEPPVTADKAGSKLDFGYLPEPPTDHGWKLAEKDPSALPRFERRDDNALGICLRVSTKGRYALDYVLAATDASYRTIELVAQFGSGGTFYAQVNMVHQGSMAKKAAWLRFEPRAIGSQAVNGLTAECGVSVRPYAKKRGWEYIRKDLSEAVREAYGKFGWRFRSVHRFRIRGELSLAYIALY